MVFSVLTFLYLFLPGTLLLCFAMPARLRNAVLMTASLFFYFYAEQGDLLLMLAVILLSWAAGLLPARSGRAGIRKASLQSVLRFAGRPFCHTKTPR